MHSFFLGALRVNNLIFAISYNFLIIFFVRFDTDVARNRRRLVQSNITTVLSAIGSMVKDGRK